MPVQYSDYLYTHLYTYAVREKPDKKIGKMEGKVVVALEEVVALRGRKGAGMESVCKEKYIRIGSSFNLLS